MTDRVFTIRNAQMQVFEQEAKAFFVLRAVKHPRAASSNEDRADR